MALITELDDTRDVTVVKLHRRTADVLREMKHKQESYNDVVSRILRCSGLMTDKGYPTTIVKQATRKRMNLSRVMRRRLVKTIPQALL